MMIQEIRSDNGNSNFMIKPQKFRLFNYYKQFLQKLFFLQIASLSYKMYVILFMTVYIKL